MRALILIGCAAASLASPAQAQTGATVYPLPGNDLLLKAAEAPDGTLFATGHSFTEGAFVMRLSADSSILWKVSFPIDEVEMLRDQAVAANGDLLVCGHHERGGYVARLDPTGALLWQTELPWEYSGGEKHQINSFVAITEAADGDVLLAGESRLQPKGDPIGIHYRLTASGAKVWGYYGDGGFLTDVVERPDGAVLFTGAWGYQGTFFMITGADGASGTEWRYDPIGATRPRISLAPGNEVYVVPGRWWCAAFYDTVICVQGWNPTHEPFQLMKLDLFGNLLWRKSYSALPDLSIDVLALDDGGAIVLGETTTPAGDVDLRLLRTDAGGAVLWQRDYGGPFDEVATAITPRANGGFLITGQTLTGAPTALDGLLLRVDGNGVIEGCPSVQGSPTAQDQPAVDQLLTPWAWTKQTDVEPTSVALETTAIFSEPRCFGHPSLGSSYCDPAVLNSTGLSARMNAIGSTDLAQSDVTLIATRVPPGKFGYFVTGMGTGQVTPPGADGQLCLAGASIHRYAQSVLQADAGGLFSLDIDPGQVPGHGAIAPGETWNFQAWFRDHNPTSTSNFTDGLALTFQ